MWLLWVSIISIPINLLILWYDWNLCKDADVKWQVYIKALESALRFYRDVEKNTPNPKFTGEVAEKALNGELH